MPTTYTTSLGLALPTTGELVGTWGTVVNDYITRYVDAAVAGTQTLSTDADVTLTTTNGSSLTTTSAQYAILNCTGARTVQRTITVPAASKSYLVINATTGGQTVKVVGAGPTTGVTLANGERALIAWDGADFVKVGGFGGSGTFTDVTITSGNLTFSGTAQRITGDMSNATVANRLAFQTSTVNGNTTVFALPNGSAVISGFQAFANSDPTNAAFVRILAGALPDARLESGITGTGTYLPMTFYTGGSERVRVDTSGNVGVGTASPGYTLDINAASGTFRVRNSTGGNDVAITNIAGPVSLIGSSGATAIALGTNNTERLRIDTSGNVGIGTSSPNVRLQIASAPGEILRLGNTTGGERLHFYTRNAVGASRIETQNSDLQLFAFDSNPVVFGTNNTERFRITSTGGITSSDLADAVGYKGTPLNEQSTAYTLVIGDMGKSIVHPASDNNARTFTIPANGTVAFPVGTTITFINMINTVTIAITTDTMYLAGAGTTGSRTLAAYGMATAVKMTSTTWIISGNGLT